MDYFNLSLPWRLLLAFLPGLSMWLFGLVPPSSVLEYALYGVILALLVLVPFISASTFRVARGVLLILTAILIQTILVWLTLDNYDFLGLGDMELVFNVLLGTLLISISVALVAPIRLTARYVAYALVAGLVSGFAFRFLLGQWMFFCNIPCPWWNDLAFTGGWVVWHLSICAAIFFGKRRGFAG